ncbi:hypothetical protein ACFY72_20740 [Streptomyces globisporus]|uniref:hypothetical protein n=1 Tax=Streptomyces globisporus TaxID=1908 RepID=UPI003678B6BB
MRIRMKVGLSGTRNGVDWPPAGEVTDIPTGEAQHLVDAGIAEKVDGDEDREGDAATGPLTTDGAGAPLVENAAAPQTDEKRPAARKAPAPKSAKE